MSEALGLTRALQAFAQPAMADRPIVSISRCGIDRKGEAFAAIPGAAPRLGDRRVIGKNTFPDQHQEKEHDFRTQGDKRMHRRWACHQWQCPCRCQNGLLIRFKIRF